MWRAFRARRGVRRRVDPRSLPAKGRTRWASALRRVFWRWWLWGIAAAGLYWTDHWVWALVCLVIAVAARLLEPRAQAPRFGLDADFAVASDEFVATMAGATGTPFVGGNSFEMLHNGDAFYPRMLEDIRAAKVSVCIEAYIYWAGEVGMTFAQALAERARAGVRVMLLLDAVGAADIGTEILQTLESAGCHIAWYNPLRWRTLGSYNNRTHRKSLIVDGAIGYTGGAGIADHWRGQARTAEEWRDVQVRFAGPAVTGLQSGFGHNWQQATGELVSGGEYYPVVPPSGPHALQVILSSPETGGSNVQTMYYLAIAAARQSILIANPYFVPDDVGLDLLIEAARRGVKVQVMVSGTQSDNWLARHNSTALYGRLLEAGIEIVEYNRSMLHHKIMTVDGVWITAGTANFDSRSFIHNEESNLSLFDAAEAAAFAARFEQDLDACAPVTLEAWRTRGLWAKVQEAVASVFEDQV